MLHAVLTAAAVLCTQATSSATPKPTDPTPHGYIQSLSGDWGEVRQRPIWNQLGLDPNALEWPGAPDGHDDTNHIHSAIRYDDVDRDGNPEAFIALFDGHTAHFFIAPAVGPRSWRAPLALTSSRYEPWEGYDQPGTLPARRWPTSDHMGGRTLIDVRTLARVPSWGDVADALFEYETCDGTAKVTEVWRYEDAFDGEFFDQVSAVALDPAAPDGTHDLLLYTRTRRTAWLLPIGATSVEDAPWPEGQAPYQLRQRRDRSASAAPPAHAHTLHPMRVAHALTGSPSQVVDADVWEHLGIDPSTAGLHQSDQARAWDPSDAPGGIWYVQAQPVYEDLDTDGLPDAFVAVRQGNTIWWIVLTQPEPGVWACAGALDGYFAEHARVWGLLPHSPSTPDVYRHQGRTLLLASSGYAVGLGGSNIDNELLLLEAGTLHTLWRERVYGGATNTPQELAIEEANGTIVITVRTWANVVERHNNRLPVRIRTWRLLPDSRELDGPTVRESF